MIWGNTHDTVLITFLGRVQNKIRRTIPNLLKSRIEQKNRIKETPKKIFFYHMLYNSQISYIGYYYSYNDDKKMVELIEANDF